METTMQDLRYACRTLRRSPGFVVAAILSLTLGIGANTAIFTLIDAVMLRPLPVRSPHELVSVGDPSRPTAHWEGGPMVDVLSYPLYQRLRDHNRVFSGLLAAGRAERVQLGAAGGNTEDIRARLVSANYFDVLGVSAVIGRTFRDDEDRAPGAGPVVVVSDQLWERRFGRARDFVGRTIWLNGQALTVVGVGPASFTGEVVGSTTDVWIPLSMQPQIQGQSRLNRADSNWLLGLGRLEPGVSLEQARTDLNLLAQQALIDFQGGQLSEAALAEVRRQLLPVDPGDRGFSWIRKNTSASLVTLMFIVAFILLIACANVADLLLARAANRQKEIAVRLAIGAGRTRLIRQLLTEGGLLAAASGLASLIVAGWGSRLQSQLLARGGPNPIPFDVDVQPNLAILAYTVAVSVATTVVFALVPAFEASRKEDTTASFDQIGPGYFQAIGIPLVEGREFDRAAFLHPTAANVRRHHHPALRRPGARECRISAARPQARVAGSDCRTERHRDRGCPDAHEPEPQRRAIYRPPFQPVRAARTDACRGRFVWCDFLRNGASDERDRPSDGAWRKSRPGHANGPSRGVDTDARWTCRRITGCLDCVTAVCDRRRWCEPYGSAHIPDCDSRHVRCRRRRRRCAGLAGIACRSGYRTSPGMSLPMRDENS